MNEATAVVLFEVHVLYLGLGAADRLAWPLIAVY